MFNISIILYMFYISYIIFIFSQWMCSVYIELYKE